MPRNSSPTKPEVRLIVERELRFVPAACLPPTTVAPPLWHDYHVTPLAAERQRNDYLDTPTQALARQSISFRRRSLLDLNTDLPLTAELTLKLRRLPEGRHLFARPEYTEPIGPDEPLAGHPLLMLAAEYTADESVGPWFTFVTYRTGVALCRENARIHLTWDRLALPDDPRFIDEEIEAELVDGPVQALESLASLLTGVYRLTYGDNGKRTRVGRYLARQGRIRFPGTSG